MISLGKKRDLARSQTDAVYHVRKVFHDGETVAACFSLPRDNYLSPVSLCFCLVVLALFGTMFCLWQYLHFFLKVAALILLFFALYHALIRVFCRPTLVVSQFAVYLYLPTQRKRVYRMTFSELKRVRVRRRLFFRNQKRFYFFKNKLTVCNSPYWKLVRFRKTNDISKLDSIDYVFFHCYSPLFLQAAANGNELVPLLSEMKKVSRTDFPIDEKRK